MKQSLVSYHPGTNGGTRAVWLYDTSGPYTDPKAAVEFQKGLPPIRRTWIFDREKYVESSAHRRSAAELPASLRLASI